MKKLLFLPLILSLFACKNDSKKIEETDPIIIDTIVAETTQLEKPESKYHYDQDWERFKTAVINKDIKGMAAFASSDEIDSEALLNSLSDESFLKKLNSTTYDDLTTEEQGEFTFLVFSTEIKGTDEEGNEYESGISLYFTQGETSLLLDYYLIKG